VVVIGSWIRRATNRNTPHHELPLVPSQNFRFIPELKNNLPEVTHDFVFYGSSNNGNRMARLNELAAQGVNIKLLAGAFGYNLSQHLIDSTAVLNIHGYESGLFETGRCLRPAALGIPIISDQSLHPKIASWEDSGVIFLPRHDFSQAAAQAVHNPDRMLIASQQLLAFVDDPKWPALAREVMLSAIVDLKNL